MINRESTKRLIKVSLISIISIVIVAYTAFESYDFIIGPQITISQPENGISIATSSVVVQGKADRIKNLYINNRPVLIDTEGNFNETILLAPGYNITLLSAQDRFERTIEHKLELVYLK